MNVLPEFVLPMILWRWVCQNHVFHSMFAPLQTKSNLILHMFLVSNAKSEQSTSIYTVFWPSKNKISAVFCQTCTQTISQIAEFPPIRSPLFAVHGHSAGLKIWQDATERHPLLHLPYLLRFTPFKSFPSCLWNWIFDDLGSSAKSFAAQDEFAALHQGSNAFQLSVLLVVKANTYFNVQESQQDTCVWQASKLFQIQIAEHFLAPQLPESKWLS